MRFAIVIGKASLLTLAGYFFSLVGLKFELAPREEGILIFTATALMIAIATWWIFRALQADYTRRVARAVAITFAILSPVSLGIALMSAGYAELLLGSPFIGMLMGVAVIAVLLNFLLCLLTMRMTQHIIKMESTHY
jgi:hypothetical protein